MADRELRPGRRWWDWLRCFRPAGVAPKRPGRVTESGSEGVVSRGTYFWKPYLKLLQRNQAVDSADLFRVTHEQKYGLSRLCIFAGGGIHLIERDCGDPLGKCSEFAQRFIEDPGLRNGISS